MFGAGHIAQSLAHMAPELGFRVIVADARKTWATPERFPDVDGLIVGWPDAVFEEHAPDRRTYVVLLSHDARFEDPVFPAVRGARSGISARWGAAARIGPAWSGWRVPAGPTRRSTTIHAPIGIDIGAETPEEVAVSILAEMVQVRYGHGTGPSLHGTEGRIHAQRGDEDGTT